MKKIIDLEISDLDTKNLNSLEWYLKNWYWKVAIIITGFVIIKKVINIPTITDIAFLITTFLLLSFYWAYLLKGLTIQNISMKQDKRLKIEIEKENTITVISLKKVFTEDEAKKQKEAFTHTMLQEKDLSQLKDVKFEKNSNKDILSFNINNIFTNGQPIIVKAETEEGQIEFSLLGESKIRGIYITDNDLDKIIQAINIIK